MTFAEKFKAARKAAGLSQQQVADELGLDRSAIAHYEMGDALPNVRNLPKISEILKIPLGELLS